MKLRLKGNSLRLRLGQSEVARLLAGDTIEESTTFGPLPSHRLVYALAPSATTKRVVATFEHNRILVHVPRDVVFLWANSNELAIDFHQPIDRDNTLYVLIEKDLACLDPSTTEPQNDAFANPQSVAGTHRPRTPRSAR